MKKLFSFILVVLLFAGILSVTAAAEGTPIYVLLQWSTTQKAEWILQPGESKYATTDIDGNVTVLDAATEEYNVKLDYPADGSVPTIYLKNATIKSTPEGLNSSDSRSVLTIGRGANPKENIEAIQAFPFRIQVEGENTLTTKNGSGIAVACQQGVTIAGSGKLTLVSDRMLYAMSSNTDVTIQDATVEMTSNMPTSQGLRPALWINKGGLTVDGAKLTLFATSGPAIWVSKAYNALEGDPYNITIKNGATVTAGHEGTNLPAVGLTGEFSIDSSSVEITAKGKCYSSKPVLTNVGAKGGIDTLHTKPYNVKIAGTYTYFICGTDIVTETLPPATTAPATTEVTEVTVPETTEATAPETTQKVPTTGVSATEGTTAASDVDNTDKDNQSSSTQILVYIILGIVIVGGVAAIAVILLLQKKKA